MLISFTGAQSTGKTTLLNELKKDSALSSCFTFIDEITRSIQREGFKINEEGDDNTQIAIMKSHLQNSKNQNAIMDRCALDGLVYTYYLFKKKKVSYNTVIEAEKIFKECISKYDIIFYIKPEFRIVKDGVRSVNRRFRRDIVKMFDYVIKYYGVKVIVLKGKVEERLNSIYRVLEERKVI